MPAAALVLLAWCWFVTGMEPFAASTTVAVLATGSVAMAVGATRWPQPGRPPAITLRVAWPWLAIGVVLVAWQLTAFLQSPRDDHPTLSSLTNAALDGHVARALAFAAWTVAAAWLARR